MFMCYHIAARITYFVGENFRMHVCVHVRICMCKHGRQVYYNYQFTSYSITKEYFFVMLKFSEVVRKLRDYYLNFIDEASLETEFAIPAEHAMVCISIGLSGCSLSILCCQYKLLIVSSLVYFVQSVTVK